MLSKTSLASRDFFTMTSFSRTAVCMRRTLDWFLREARGRGAREQDPVPFRPQAHWAPGTWSTPELSRVGYSETPNGQGPTPRVHDRGQQGPWPTQQREFKKKILKHLQILPLPSGNTREAKRGRTREGSEEEGETEHLGHHAPPPPPTACWSPLSQPYPLHFTVHTREC